ncbi:MAG: hypothetical protein CM1200mP20_13750 [Pseudomonadota bacterium]|nr:MAG: hypothetical protein CM1200mP20_13750 [Pseudomonadota bacterium]
MRPITMKPVRPSQGACRLALPCPSSSPREAEPGGRPIPRKSSAVSAVTEPGPCKRHEGDRSDHRVG